MIFQTWKGCVLPAQLTFQKWFWFDLLVLKMIHQVYGKIDEIKVCSCHFYQVFYAIKKILTTDEIDRLICTVSGKIKPWLFFFDGTNIVCCVNFII